MKKCCGHLAKYKVFNKTVNLLNWLSVWLIPFKSNYLIPFDQIVKIILKLNKVLPPDAVIHQYTCELHIYR